MELTVLFNLITVRFLQAIIVSHVIRVKVFYFHKDLTAILQYNAIVRCHQIGIG